MAMKLIFDELITADGKVKVSFNNEETWTEYNVDDIINTGITFTEDECSDLTKIRIAGTIAKVSDIKTHIVNRVVEGATIYNDTENIRLQLAPNNEILFQKNLEIQGNSSNWDTLARINMNSNNDLIITDANESLKIGHQITTAKIYHFNDNILDEDNENLFSVTTDGTYIEPVDSITNNSQNKCIQGSVLVPINQDFQGIIAFETKAAEIQIGTITVKLADGSSEEIPIPLYDYNTAMRNTSMVDTNKTLGQILGLTEPQIQNGIFY